MILRMITITMLINYIVLVAIRTPRLELLPRQLAALHRLDPYIILCFIIVYHIMIYDISHYIIALCILYHCII